jgi:hypothetical protein
VVTIYTTYLTIKTSMNFDTDCIFRIISNIDDIGKYSFVIRTIQLWNQLPADALGTLSSKSSNFR